MKQSGVYAIINLTTGRRYIGSSVNILARWSDHLSRLRRGIHHSLSLQSDWSFFGAEAFGWQILEDVAQRGDLIAAEQRWLDDTPTAYNAARRAGGGPRDGFRHSEESKQRMSLVVTAKWHTRHANPMSDTQREAIRAANTNRVKSPEECARLSRALKGRVITWGAKISASRKGITKGVPWSAARRMAQNAKKASIS